MKTRAYIQAVKLLGAVLLISGLTFSAISTNSSPAHAQGSYNNALLADKALTYVDQWGGNACRDAGRVGDGQCKAFVNCIIWMVSGGSQWPAPGYNSGFQGAGGVPVSAANAVKGDIIQVGDSDNDRPLHTAIIVKNLGGGRFNVVDSNNNYDEIVHQHDYDPPNGARFWRMGKNLTGGSSSIANGDYIQVTGKATVYRVAGGAPLKVYSWSGVGGAKPVKKVTQSQFDALPDYPANGTAIQGVATGKIYIVAGRAPMYIHSWDAVGGSKPFTNVDQRAIDEKLRGYPSDGTVVRGYESQRIYQVINQETVYVSDPSQVQGTPVVIDDWAITNQLKPNYGNEYYLNNDFDGSHDLYTTYGLGTDEVIVGDWDGDGIDTLGVRRGDTYYLNNNFDGQHDISVVYGNSSDEVVVGDWDGNGTDTLGVRRGDQYYLNNDFDSDHEIHTGYGRSTDNVVTGDWDGNGIDTLGVRRN